MTDHSLVYPMSVNYRPDWGIWEALREGIYQEFLDNFPEGFEMRRQGKKASSHSAGRMLIVEGHGKVFTLKDLILGVTDKRDDDSKRGQHGEGTKVAWLVLTRLGIPFEFHSGDWLYSTRKRQLHGEECMQVSWKEAPFFDGARYILHYDGHLFEERVLLPDDPRIVWEDEKGRRILDGAENPGIFVKNIWVQKALLYQPLSFGYDLQDAKLDLSRNMVNIWEAAQEIGRLWGRVSEPDLLEAFYTITVKDLKLRWGERDANLRFPALPPKAHSRKRKAREALLAAHAQAFKNVLGPKAVVRTSKESAREAEWKGADPIEVPYHLREGLSQVMPTDLKFLEEKNKDSDIYVPVGHLSPREKKILAWLRRKVKARWPKLQVVASLMENKNGKAEGNLVHLNPHILRGDPLQALATTAHEVSHIVDGVKDLTADQIRSVARVACYLFSDCPLIEESNWGHRWK